MSEAGWGVPSWVPVASARAIARQEAAEARQARAEQGDRERRIEELREQNLTLAVRQAEERGQVLDVMALARGEISGRSVQDVFASAVAAADRDDARDAIRVTREGTGEPVHIDYFADPVIHRAATPTGRAIWRRAERFRAVLAARRKLAEAERAAERSRDDIGYVCEAPRRADPVTVVTAARSSGARPVSYR